MTDVPDSILYVIDQDTFKKLKPSVVTRITNKKIEQILALDCFNENSPKMAAFNKPKTAFLGKPPQQHHQMHHNTLSSNHRNQQHGMERNNNNVSSFNRHNTQQNQKNNQSQNHYTAIMSKPPRSRVGLTNHDKLIREINSNLNKISILNYRVISDKLEKMIDPSNVKEIINIILGKCASNGTYIDQMVYLLTKSNCLSVVYEEQVREGIESYISIFTSTIESSIKDLVNGDYNDYDQFCGFLKRKAELMSSLKLVLLFIKMDKYDTPSNDLYFDKSLSLLEDFVSDVLPIHMQDMMVQVIAMFFNEDEEVSEYSYRALCEAYVTSLKDSLSMKSRFLCMDIIKKYDPDRIKRANQLYHAPHRLDKRR